MIYKQRQQMLSCFSSGHSQRNKPMSGFQTINTGQNCQALVPNPLADTKILCFVNLLC